MIRLLLGLLIPVLAAPVAASQVVVDTDPSGLQVVIDGWFRSTPWTAPDDGTWAPGTEHTLRALTPIDASPDSAWVFQSWSDGGDVVHTIVVPPEPITYVAAYELVARVQVSLRTAPLPLDLRIDGAVTQIPVDLLWLPGEIHTLEAFDQNRAGVGWLFGSWSNGGPRIQDYVVGTAGETLVATFVPETSGVLVKSEPSGRTVRIDGVAFTTPRFKAAMSGQPVEIEAVTPQAAGPDSSWGFQFWSDGGDTTHTVTAGPEVAVEATYTFEANVHIEIGSDPSGLIVLVDGVDRATPWTGNWAPRTQHALFALSPQAAGMGQEWRWIAWSDGGDQGHAILATEDGQIVADYELVDLPGVIFDTDPTGLALEIDGSARPTPWFESAPVGAGIPVRALTPQERDAGSVWAFDVWSDGGDTSHVVTVPPLPITVTASYLPEPKVEISVGTEPPGLVFHVDGVGYDAPEEFLWGRGAVHELSSITPQYLGGFPLDFEAWSDGVTTLTRTVITPAVAAEYRARFVLPVNAGTILLCEPIGLWIDVDGVPRPTPNFFGWHPGDEHTLRAITPQTMDGIQYSFVQWADGELGPFRTWIQGAGTDTVRALFAEDPSTYCTLDTAPTGLTLVADGVRYPTPAVLPWTPGSVHTIEADSLVEGSALERLRFGSWSDGGPRVHTIVVPLTSRMYVASYVEQFLVTTIPDPIGTVLPPTGWHDAGVPLTLTAIPEPRGFLQEWEGTGEGSYSGPANPVTITPGGPVTQIAHFGTIAYEFSLSFSDTDPEVHEAGPVGVGEVFLWFVCGTGEGMTRLETSAGGSIEILGFSGRNGVINGGSATDLLLVTPGCVGGPYLLGSFAVLDPDGGDLCLAPSPTTGRLAALDCTSPTPRVYGWPEDMMIRGVASDGGTWCVAGRACGEGEGPIPVRVTGLEAVAEESAIVLRWSTPPEVEPRGFHVYRRVAPVGVEERRTAELIVGASPHVWRDEAVEKGVTYRYEIGAVDGQGREDRHGPVEVTASSLPEELVLDPVRPNPFRSSASLRFALPTGREVRCDVFDVTGRLVTTLLDDRIGAGPHDLVWDGRDRTGAVMPGGVYFLRLRAGDRTRTAKIVRLPVD